MTAIGLDVASYLDEPIEEWVLPIKHLSASSLGMLARCPEQWRQRYVLGHKARPYEAQVIGKAFHKVAEFNFAQKVASHEDIPVSDLVSWYDDVGFEHAIADSVRDAESDDFEWDTDREGARKRGRAITYAYQSQVAPRIQPTSVETRIAADVGLPISVIGYADCITSERVIDLKTSKQSKRSPKPEWRFQAAIYGSIMDMPIDFHIGSATETTHRATINTPVEAPELSVWMPPEARKEAARNIRAMAWMADHFMRTLGPDEPWPTTGMAHPWACNFCGFRPGCPAWKGLE